MVILKPIAILSKAPAAETAVCAPIRVFLAPVVIVLPDDAPIQVLLTPPVSADSADEPNALFAAPVIRPAPIALDPNALLVDPPALVMDPFPNAELLAHAPTTQEVIEEVPNAQLLEMLVENNGEVVSRQVIISNIWEGENAIGITDQALDALVRRLRDRLMEIDPDHSYITTVRGHGLRLDNLK